MAAAQAVAVVAVLSLLLAAHWSGRATFGVAAASVSSSGSPDGSACAVHAQCDAGEACIQGKCTDPCAGACGLNAKCEVSGFQPVCSCLAGFAGDALTQCFPKDGYKEVTSCRVWSECSPQEICITGQCGDPCPKYCGRNTKCTVNNHAPTCTCEEGSFGEPSVGCYYRQEPKTSPPKRSTPPPPPAQARADWLPALHRTCLRCLCEASTTCNLNFGCQEGYCGPFGVSRIYWHEAGRPVLEYDDPERKEAYEDCAKDYKCSSRIVTEYLKKLAKDCNGDGRINCDDFAMSHHNGGYSCHLPLNRSEAGTKYLQRYLSCRGEDEGPYPHVADSHGTASGQGSHGGWPRLSCWCCLCWIFTILCSAIRKWL